MESTVKHFMKGADPVLIVCGKKYNYTVVTQEKTTRVKKLKIPIACSKFGVRCENIHTVLRDEYPALILDGKRETLGTRMRTNALLLKQQKNM